MARAKKPKVQFVVCGPIDSDKLYYRGIHLDCPNTSDIQDAIEQAERDMFSTIYLHYPNIIRFDSASLATLKRADERRQERAQ